MSNKWSGLEGEGYRIEDLGRPAVFLIPVRKLKVGVLGRTTEEKLRRFLIGNFGAFTSSRVPSFGFWKDIEQATISDECAIYEVSFVGKDKISILLKELAQTARDIDEKCIYFKAGQYACLVYPAD